MEERKRKQKRRGGRKGEGMGFIRMGGRWKATTGQRLEWKIGMDGMGWDGWHGGPIPRIDEREAGRYSTGNKEGRHKTV